ncbi:MAG: M20/M25/M40 family metallo-hydrolase [bacterium]
MNKTSPFPVKLTFALLVAAAPLVSPGGLRAQELSAIEAKIVAYVEHHQEEAIAFLEKVVNINSGTMNSEGVRRVGQFFRQEFDALGFETRWVSMPDSVNRGGHLFAERRGSQGKRLLLIGHLDTVFEPESPFQRFERRDSIATGPGVNDMKGGDVVMLWALKALHNAGVLENTHIIVALHGDEEKIAAPIRLSRHDIIEAAKRSDMALAFEAEIGDMSSARVARRGSSSWTLSVTGIRAHSSQIFKKRFGSGAIFEATRILNSFHEELRGEQYLTFNPGVILGGTEVVYDAARTRGTVFGKGNVIAQTVTVDGDLRFISEAQKERARQKMRDIVRQNLPGTSATISFRDKYTAMAPGAGNLALLELLDKVSRDLGYGPVEALDPSLGGAADIAFAAAHVEGGLDGLGAPGSGAHTTNEEANLRALVKTTERAALLIYRLTR